MAQGKSFYECLGIETFINAHSCNTTMGGSIMQSAVVEAMVGASRSFMSLDKLHDVTVREASITLSMIFPVGKLQE